MNEPSYDYLEHLRRLARAQASVARGHEWVVRHNDRMLTFTSTRDRAERRNRQSKICRAASRAAKAWRAYWLTVRMIEAEEARREAWRLKIEG